MTMLLTDADELVALGAFVGAQVLVVCFCVIKANAYRERALLLHAAATMMAVLTVQTLAGAHPLFPESALLLVLALAGMQVRDLMSQTAPVHTLNRAMMVVNFALLPLLAVAAAWNSWFLVLGVIAWSLPVGALLRGAWTQTRPWVWWLVPGFAALCGAGVTLAWSSMGGGGNAALPVGGLLTIWTACVYLATGWRGRILGETRVRVAARNRIDPLTGLSMPIVFNERVHAARTLMQRYGHPSVLLVVHIENLRRLSDEFGPDSAESAVLSAADRVRQSLRDGDVAARLSYSRIAVLAEGLSLAEGASNIASRILVAGLKEPLAAVPAEFLHFRVVLAPVPVEELSAKVLLQRLGSRLDQELQSPSERRIVSLSHEELMAT